MQIVGYLIIAYWVAVEIALLWFAPPILGILFPLLIGAILLVRAVPVLNFFILGMWFGFRR